MPPSHPHPQLFLPFHPYPRCLQRRDQVYSNRIRTNTTINILLCKSIPNRTHTHRFILQCSIPSIPVCYPSREVHYCLLGVGQARGGESDVLYFRVSSLLYLLRLHLAIVYTMCPCNIPHNRGVSQSDLPQVHPQADPIN